MTADQRIAWLAGVLEGEGCFHLVPPQGKRRAAIRVSLEMCDRDVLERAAEAFPASGNIGVVDPNRARSVLAAKKRHASRAVWKNKYKMNWYGARAEELMRAVYPFMMERRKAKIDECLATPNLSHIITADSRYGMPRQGSRLPSAGLIRSTER